MTETLEQGQRGHIEPTTWRCVHIGNIVRDKKDRFWTVIDEQLGWIMLKAAKDGELKTMPKPPAGDVDIYVPSEFECLTWLREELGARGLREIEEREHTTARALNWRLEPLPRSAVKIRDHIYMVHGSVYVDDLLGRFQRAKEAGDKGRAKKQLDTLVEAHATMHDDPGTYPMAYPHHHAAITP